MPRKPLQCCKPWVRYLYLNTETDGKSLSHRGWHKIAATVNWQLTHKCFWRCVHIASGRAWSTEIQTALLLWRTFKMTSQWAHWRFKSPASRLFTQPFIQGADQRKHQNSASLAFVRGIHRSPVNSSNKGPVTRKMFPFDDVIMTLKADWKPRGNSRKNNFALKQGFIWD